MARTRPEQWTPADMPDLSGTTVVVTGANSGLGLETTRELMRTKAHVILACRSMAKARQALDRLESDDPSASCEIMELDLATLASVREFAEHFVASHDRLNVLINNAGIMMVPEGKTSEGYEQQFGTNHLGHFALTGLLLELLLSTPGSRVVTVSSGAHRAGSMDFDNLMFADGTYSPLRAYGRSKLANLLFTYELQRRLEAAGADMIAVAAHPGVANTNLGSHLTSLKIAKPLMGLLTQDPAMGALPTLRAATDPDVSGGQYFGPGGFMEQRGYPVVVESNEASHSEPDAKVLWQISEELTGVDYHQLHAAK